MKVQISQSVNKNGLFKWYWFYVMDSGHIFHISEGHNHISKCIIDLQKRFEEIDSLAKGENQKLQDEYEE